MAPLLNIFFRFISIKISWTFWKFSSFKSDFQWSYYLIPLKYIKFDFGSRSYYFMLPFSISGLLFLIYNVISDLKWISKNLTIFCGGTVVRNGLATWSSIGYFFQFCYRFYVRIFFLGLFDSFRITWTWTWYWWSGNLAHGSDYLHIIFIVGFLFQNIKCVNCLHVTDLKKIWGTSEHINIY